MEENSKSIREALETSNRKLLEAQELAKIGNWEADVDTGKITWSPVVYDIFELDPESYQPTIQSFKEMVHPDDEAKVYEEDVKAFHSGYFNLVHRIITKKDKVKYVHEIASRVENSKGAAIFYRGTIQDITELMEAEIALSNQKKRTDAIISGAKLGTYEWDLTNESIILNERWANIIGYSLDEISPITKSKWFSFVHPDDLYETTKIFSSNLNLQSEFYEFEIRLKHKGNFWVWVWVTGKVGEWNEKGDPKVLFGTISDISKRKVAEVELKKTETLLKQTNKITKTGGWSLDVATGFISWTDNTKNIYEVPADFQPRFDSNFKFMAFQEEVEGLKKEISEAIQKHEQFDHEVYLKSGKGRKFWARIIGIPEINNGEVTKVFGTVQDIDQQKQNELALAIKTNEYNELLDNIPIAVYRLRHDGEFDFISSTFKKLFGLQSNISSANEFIAEYIHPEDKTRLDEANIIALEKHQPLDEQVRAIVKKETRWFRIKSSPKRENDGNWYWFGTISDITGIKNAEFELKENQRLLDLFFNQSMTGFFFMMLDEPITWDDTVQKKQVLDYVFEHAHLTRVNQAMLDQYLAKEEQLIGFTPKDFFKHDLEQGKKLFEELFDTGKVLSNSIEVRFDGVEVVIEGYYMCLYDEYGRITGHFGIQNNITNRIKIEEELENQRKFQALIAEISSDLINIDFETINGRINDALKKIGQFFNVDRAYIFQFNEEMSLMTNTHEWCEEGIEPQIDYLQNYAIENTPFWKDTFLRSETVVVNELNDLPKSAKSERKLLEIQGIQSLVILPIVKNDRTIGYFGCDKVNEKTHWKKGQIDSFQIISNIFSDLFVKKSFEEELIKAKEGAIAANEAKSMFLANMSHEIRTPLNGIVGFSELLINTQLNELQENYIKHVFNSAQSLLAIINDVLDFSKIEAGKMSIEIKEVNLLELLESATSFITFQSNQKDLELIIDFDTKAPIFIQADEFRLKQVLINLLANAVKFTEEGSIILKLEYIKTSNLVRFQVIDTGIGISDKQKKSIFSAFEQADVSTTRKYGGSGLGLSISNKLLQLMDSELELDSKIDYGSNFYFDLPLHSLEKKYLAEYYQVRENIGKVLVVEDNPIQNKALCNIINAWGISYDAVTSALEAWKLLLDGANYQFFIIDKGMDNISGVELIEMIQTKLKEQYQNTPIILLDQQISDTSVMVQNIDTENIFILAKPLIYSDLLSTLNKLYLSKEQLRNQELENSEHPQLKDFKISKILVAEDNQINKLLIFNLLGKIFPLAEIIYAENGLEAIEQFKIHQPDIILMDVQMPEMGGIEATEIIRAIDKSEYKIPIIALSAGVLNNEKSKALSSGIDLFLEKPLLKNDLVKAFEKLYRNVKITNSENHKTQSIEDNLVSFDREELNTRLGNDAAVFQSFLTMVTQNLKDSEQFIQQHLNAKDYKMMDAELHKLKGTALASSFSKLGQLIKQYSFYKSNDQSIKKYVEGSILQETKNLQNILNRENGEMEKA